MVFEDLPRTGLPEFFDSSQAYENYIKTLVNTGCISDPTKIWWDDRPHSNFPTLEFRVCDCTTKIDEDIYRRGFIAENKWRAMKDGVDAKLIDFGKEKEIPLKSLIEELFELIDDVVDELDSREELEHVRTILKEGTSADRQLRKFEETGSLEAVVDMITRETVIGCT